MSLPEASRIDTTTNSDVMDNTDMTGLKEHNNELRTPIHIAALNGDIESLTTLTQEDSLGLNKKDVNGQTPLHLAGL